jgi:putative membrane protein
MASVVELSTKVGLAKQRLKWRPRDRERKLPMNKLNMSGRVILLTLATWMAMACSSDPEEPQSPPGASQGNEAAPSTAEAQPVEWGTAVTDGQILEALAAVDTAEIEQAQVALSKAQSPRVREFATHMVEEHSASKRSGEEIAAAAGATRSDSVFSLNLKSKAAEVLQTLNASDAAAFDHAYIMSQVQQHQEVLKLLTERMIPAASSSPVREHATKAQTMVQQHLERAQTIQL